MLKISAISLFLIFAYLTAHATTPSCADLFQSKEARYKWRRPDREVRVQAMSELFARARAKKERRAIEKWMSEGRAEVARMYQGVVRSRDQFGVELIKSEADLKNLKPGTIAILSAKNSGPSILEEIYLNSLNGSFPGWKIVNYDFEQDFYSDDALISQIVVYGSSVVRFPMGLGSQWSVDRLLEAIELSKADNDRVWEVRTHETGSWKKAEANTNRQMLKNFVIEE